MKKQTAVFFTVKFLILITLSLSAILILRASPVVAGEQKSMKRVANHAFSFGGMGLSENPGIEILNFQYGDSKAPGTYVEDAWLATGHIRQAGSVNGMMPVGDFLYVKWRVVATGQVYEDRVDLKGRLPPDMDHKIIHFDISGPQLRVNLIEGIRSANFHALGKPDCPAASYAAFQCTRIYPDHWANF